MGVNEASWRVRTMPHRLAHKPSAMVSTTEKLRKES